mmetsp:Transcript_12177/g.34342  ORF Transcript_12177/g.34342 Transcript_12177/m.34342 type:complete len:223 (+) Transcript_12177:55-723(+)|eukprot:CAMPEP_0119132664 /NCGR_PEP_ID=MMETSP1310-20130426/12014_1 /TAXON_ID=464262 /ORGANISM="Genus nov. species nov., Strain RCC2339" /LENGTH=222 /DNA_ID=CAMNT_0007123307 /DNA_START=41 /DNA_END=709 /DNA_ORIENTATION=+
MAVQALAKVEKLVNDTKFHIDSEAVEALPTLETFVRTEVEQGMYLLDANLLVLKIYKIYPSHHKQDIVRLILAKAIMQFPSNDFRLCTYLIPKPQVDEGLESLYAVGDTLEQGNFVGFWVEAEKNKELLSKIPGFYDSARVYMISILSRTFSSVDKEALRVTLNLDVAGLDELVAKHKWAKTVDTVEIAPELARECEPQQEHSEASAFARMSKWPFTQQYIR